jgi:hypothetical protein
VGAPIGNANAQRHGFYSADPTAVTIDDAIAGLVDKLARLDAIMDAQDLATDELLRLFALYTQASSRLGRLLRERHTISGDAADSLSDAIATALEEVGELLGVDGGL